MLIRRSVVILCLVVWTSPGAAMRAEDDVKSWKAGTARVCVTPDGSMWMAGYAARTKPSEGKVHDLFAKSLALEDASGSRLVIVAVDLVGIPRPLRDWLEQECRERLELPAAGLMLNASHTHCGPELRADKASIFGLDADRIAQSQQYMEQLQGKLFQVIEESLANLAPAKVGYTHGRAGFAMNRRLPTSDGVLNRPYPDGPVDHDVPVLRVEAPDGGLRAVLFGYACHSTTLGFYQFCGDYAGFTQVYLEDAHPGVQAMFLAGCGADQNPQPRRTLELAQHHGRALAVGVEAALLGPTHWLRAQLRPALSEVPLEFAEPPSREALEEQTKSKNKYVRRHAERLLRELDESGSLRSNYPYLVQVVRVGDDLLMVALAGEVVVDYSLRLKDEFGADLHVWPAAYSNDVFGYVPSERVLEEGGYEGGGAMIYTVLPGPFAPGIEGRIFDTIHELTRSTAPQNTP